jgi:hypothetical protein
MMIVRVAFVLAFLFCHAQAGNDTILVLVDVDQAQSSDRFSKLSPTLSVTKTSGGILKGADSLGRVVISLSPSALNKLKNDSVVRTVTENVPSDCTPVRQLKISYKSGNPPASEELSALGLRIVENYVKGNFLIVEPTNGIIHASLVSQLEENAKVQHVAPVLHIKAMQSDKS